MSEVVSDSKTSIRFLQAFAPDGGWVLTAIIPDGGKTFTDTFGPGNEEACLRWIDSHQGIKNIYFMVNPATHALQSKAAKTDVREMAWLHVDVDPRVGEDRDTERARIYKKLGDFKPEPTLIIDSGGGFQAFWKLETPVPVNGEEKRCEELEAYNQQLELLLGGDHCFNLDRIMRLPGTINVPDAKKRKKGRVAALAKAMVWKPTRIYELNSFTAAPRVQTGDEGFTGGGARVKISGNLPRIGDVSELPVTDKVRAIIVQGSDPDEPTKWSSRSEVLFWVICELVRANVDDDTIASVIMDPDFGISASVLDKPRPEKYAARQIQRGREEAIEPWLRKLNEKHAVIADIGGKCRVISEVMDPALGRPRLSRQSFEDFRNRYRNIGIQIGINEKGNPICKQAGSWWLDHKARRQYETIVFAPGKEAEDSYNLWRGFSCEAVPGDCSLFLTHMHDIICGGNVDHFNYLIRWMASAVQSPDRPGEVAIVLRGKQGTGKGMFVKAFGSLFGRHFLQVSDPKHLVGSFNSHLRDCVVLFGDEAFYAGDKKHEAVLKMLVTEEHITFEAKGVDAEMGPNYTHLLLSSNSDWVVPAGAEERRFFALDVAEDHMQDKRYFAALRSELEGGGRSALLHNLMTYDLSGFEVRTAPKTAALRDQKEFSFTLEQQWFHERLTDGTLLKDQDLWNGSILVDRLYEDFCEFAKATGVMRRLSRTALGRFLHKLLGSTWPEKYQEWADVWVYDETGQQVKKRMRPYFYRFPDVELCRKRFDENCGGPFNWPQLDRPPAPLPLEAELREAF